MLNVVKINFRDASGSGIVFGRGGSFHFRARLLSKAAAFPRSTARKIESSRLKYPDTCSHSNRASWLQRICIRVKWSWPRCCEIGPRNSNQLGVLDRLVFTSRAVRRDAAGFSSWESEPVVAQVNPSHSSGHLGWATRSLRQVGASAKEPALLVGKQLFVDIFPGGFCCLLIIEIRFIYSYTLVLSQDCHRSMKRNFLKLSQPKEDLFSFTNLKILHFFCDDYFIRFFDVPFLIRNAFNFTENCPKIWVWYFYFQFSSIPHFSQL